MKRTITVFAAVNLPAVKRNGPKLRIIIKRLLQQANLIKQMFMHKHALNGLAGSSGENPTSIAKRQSLSLARESNCFARCKTRFAKFNRFFILHLCNLLSAFFKRAMLSERSKFHSHCIKLSASLNAVVTVADFQCTNRCCWQFSSIPKIYQKSE